MADITERDGAPSLAARIVLVLALANLIFLVSKVILNVASAMFPL